MKGKRHTTEEKIRILREADSGKNIIEVCKDRNISEVTFHRWKREFGMMDLNEAKRLKELERENSELKKMLADSLLKNRVLEAINAKNGEPGAQATDGRLRGGRRPVFRASGVPLPRPGPWDLSLSGATTDGAPVPVGGAHPRVVGRTPAFRLSPDRGAAAPRGLVRQPQAGAAGAASRGLTGAATMQTPGAPWRVDRAADAGDAPRACVDVGLYRRRHRARRCVTDAHRARRAHEGGARLAARAADRCGRGHRPGQSCHRRTRRTGVHPLRQRTGVYRKESPAVAGRAKDQNHLHHPSEPVGKWVRRKLPQPLPRRMPEPRATLDADRSARRDRRLPPRLQHGAAAQLPRLRLAATLRGEKHFTNPRLRAGPPSRSVPPPGIANPHRIHHINQRLRLTSKVEQFRRPSHSHTVATGSKRHYGGGILEAAERESSDRIEVRDHRLAPAPIVVLRDRC